MKKYTLFLCFLSLFCASLAQNPTTSNSANIGQSNVQTYDTKFFDKMKWRNIGPQRGGRSLGCTGSPGRINEYYFGATGGGLWKTTDGGQEWAAVTDGKISCSSIGAVAVAETNPDVIYIGGGETQLGL
jgi:photosystem II stability/assembly factor-like uncharacterized protein